MKHLIDFLHTRSGGKRVLDLYKTAYTLGFVFIILICLSLFFKSNKTHSINQSPTPLIDTHLMKQELKKDTQKTIRPKGVASNPIQRKPVFEKKVPFKEDTIEPIQFDAPMLFENQKLSKLNGLGIKVQGTLLQTIDSRNPTMPVTVLLSSGVLHYEQELLPPGTTVLGSFSYPRDGKDLYIEFQQAQLPNHTTIKLKAHASSLKSRSTSIRAKLHKNTGSKLASIIGSRMVQATGEILTQKEALSQYGEVTPKSNVRNAFLQGTASIAEMETARQLQELGNKQRYVTLDAGTTLNVYISSLRN